MPVLAEPPTLAQATISEDEGVRYLHLDSRFIQGAMRLDDPHALELDYIQNMMAWLVWRPVDETMDTHVVQLGLGAGALTRFCHGVLRTKTTAVEINPSVIAANRAWFRLPPNDARLSVVEDDAARWVADPAHAGTAQVLNVDLYDQEAAAPVLDDEAFYTACRQVLDDRGVMTVNLFGCNVDVAGSARNIAAVFGRSHVWLLPPMIVGNTVVVAVRDAEVPSCEELDRRVDTIEQRYGLPARRWLRALKPLSSFGP
jgi:spermidine synthase